MLRTINKDITIIADTEVLEEIIVGVEAVERRVVSVTFEIHDDFVLVGYLDQDRIVEISGACDSAAHGPIPVDLPLKVGEAFKLGIRDMTSGVANCNVSALVEEK